MQERKRGSYNKKAGQLRKEVQEIQKLQEEKLEVEEGNTYTRVCTGLLTLICC